MALSCLLTGAFGAPADPAGIEFFERRIRPALVEHCYKCHSAEAEKLKGELHLDSQQGLLKGGESGPIFVPGKPEESLLIKAVRRLDKDLAMPPKKELPAAVVDDFVAWVKMGAPLPPSAAPEARVTKSATGQIDYAAERQKWAFRRPEAPGIPEVEDGARIKNEIDRFVLARLEAERLPSAPMADKRTLLRRATYDLTGLPPTPEEGAAFLADHRADAFAKVVERLLASPHYGERWGRHWLDVARYADSLDSRGLGQDGDILDAWRYRDWVVNAFNRDHPYNQFMIDQVAGDILAARDWDPDKVIATGLYAIGNWGNGDSDKQKVYTDIVDDQIDVTTRGFLGLTISCARCHDHKFDPITTADYYSLAGIFFSSRILEQFQAPTAGEKLMRIPLVGPEEKAKRAELQRRLTVIEAELGGGLRPLTEVQRDLLGKPGLIGWRPKGADNPSLVINPTNAEISFLTIKLPPRTIALHPGPKTAATAVWKSPRAGRVRISAAVRDADPNCGNGIEWEVRHGVTKLGGGALDNGGSATFPEKEITVAAGDLLHLVIKPRGEYSCDSTQVEFTVHSADGASSNLREALVSGVAQGDRDLWWICAGEGAKLGPDTPHLAALEAERQRLTSELAPPPMCQGLQEGGIPGSAHAGIADARIHVRGRYDRLGETRPRAFPVLLQSNPQTPVREGSGRLELARWLASSENPLTARVMVNRIWQHHFSEGLVRTPNNFGKLGEPPTHPELLDWLALELIKSGWSIKAMHRLIMGSATYQQSATAPVPTVQADPENRLLGRQNRRRLSAEEVRDSLLAVGGALDRTAGGPSVRDIQTPRRTLYLTTVRSERATYQMLFDGADPNTIVERRTDSVIAPQALWLLNHPFVLAQAKTLAERMNREGGEEFVTRVNWLYDRLFLRAPRPEELERARAAFARFEGGNGKWEQFCHVLICSNEFSYVE